MQLDKAIVPLGERLRYMQLFRLGCATLVVVYHVAVPDASQAMLRDVVVVSLAYAVSLSVVGQLWRRWAARGLLVFGAMLIVDGLYLVWAVHVSGGFVTPVSLLLMVHLVVVTLMASYRTGLKLALWQSLLLFVVFSLEEQEFLAQTGQRYSGLPGTEFGRVVTFVAGLWLIAFATAAFSAVNERELRRRSVDLQALAEMTTALERVHSRGEIATTLVETLVDAFGFPRVAVMATPEYDDPVVGAYGTAVTEELDAGADLVIWQSWESRQTMLLRTVDRGANPRLNRLMPDAVNLIIVPMHAEDRAIAALVIEHTMRQGSRIEQRVVSMVEQFAAHTALALHNAQLLDNIRHTAETDGLTGVANRATFELTLQREVLRATRNNEPLSLVMVDIDFFKRVNDTYGHQAGDDILRCIAETLATEVRSFDTVARYGGEEFAVICPAADQEEARSIAERLRRGASNAVTDHPVTLSAGVATIPDHANDATVLVRAADLALYESKVRGRNRVTVASSELLAGAAG